MDFSDPQFWLAVLQIIAIDVLLGGDNAVVIALACRRLPEKQRARGIMWGVVGAIGLRILLLFFAVQVLALPYLKLIGALLLLWIGVKLLLPEEHEKHGEVQASTSLIGAIRTIVVADAVMSLDNVVAVAGAARGEFVLVVFGIAVSVPIIVWGSRFVLKLMDRFPIVITLGAALLGWIAGEMATSDIGVERWVGKIPEWAHYAAAAAGVLIVVALGKGLAGRGAATRPRIVTATPKVEPSSRPGKQTLRILIPVEDEETPLRAIEHLLRKLPYYRLPVEIHLLNTQHPARSDLGHIVSNREVQEFHEEEGLKMLAPVRKRLDREGVPYHHHVAVGESAATIADYAHENEVDEIHLAADGGFLMDSLASRLSDLSRTPVLLVK